MSRPRPNIVTDLADLRELGRRYRVRLIRYRRDAAPETEDRPSTYSSIAAALLEADRLQGLADERCEPVTVFVTADGVPIRRAGDRP